MSIREHQAKKTFYKNFVLFFFMSIAVILVGIAATQNIANSANIENLSIQIEHLTEVLASVEVIEKVKE